MSVRIRAASVTFALVAIAGMLGGTACSDGGAGSALVRRDSAGVEIVENRGARAWTAATAWTVSDTPTVSIGGDESDSTAIFSRVQNAIRMSDGRILVPNGGTRELRFYHANGRFIKSVGRLGEGPGEFDWLGKVFRTDGDSLIIWDPNNARLTVFDSGGRFVRSVPLRSGQGISFPEPFGRASDGSLIGRTGSRNNATGAFRFASFYVRYGPDLAPTDTVAKRPGNDFFTQPCGDNGICGYGPPFARRTSAGFHNDRLYVGTGDRYEIEVIDMSGRVVRLIRDARPIREVSSADAERQRETFLSDARDPARRAELEKVYAMMTVPQAMPAYGELKVDRSGNLWVEEYRTTDDAPLRWTVFDSSGRVLGTLGMPSGLRVDEIGDDYVLGVFRDSLDVEHVRLHAIAKPGGR